MMLPHLRGGRSGTQNLVGIFLYGLSTYRAAFRYGIDSILSVYIGTDAFVRCGEVLTSRICSDGCLKIQRILFGSCRRITGEYTAESSTETDYATNQCTPRATNL